MRPTSGCRDQWSSHHPADLKPDDGLRSLEGLRRFDALPNKLNLRDSAFAQLTMLKPGLIQEGFIP